MKPEEAKRIMRLLDYYERQFDDSRHHIVYETRACRDILAKEEKEKA